MDPLGLLGLIRSGEELRLQHREPPRRQRVQKKEAAHRVLRVLSIPTEFTIFLGFPVLGPTRLTRAASNVTFEDITALVT